MLPVVPDDIPISDFMLDERYGRHPLDNSLDPFTCGLSGKSYSAHEVVNRVNYLARSLAKGFGWQPSHGTEWDKVVCIFSLNVVGNETSRHILRSAANKLPLTVDRLCSSSVGDTSLVRYRVTS
jgi:hypothetical protein